MITDPRSYEEALARIAEADDRTSVSHAVLIQFVDNYEWWARYNLLKGLAWAVVFGAFMYAGVWIIFAGTASR